MVENSVLALQGQISSAGANDMRRKGELIDVILVCGSETFPAHRVILSAGSAFFRSMFLSGMEESSSRQIELRGMDPVAVSVVIDVIYGQSVRVDRDDCRALQEVIAASHMMQVYPLYEHCCQEFLLKLSPNYFVDIWNTATIFQHCDMLQEIPKTLAKDFRDVQRSSDFLMLNPNQMKQLMSRAGKTGTDADCLVQGLLTWVKRDASSRQEHLAPLFANIDLASLSPSYLSQLFMTEDLIKKSLELMSSLMAVATSRMILGQSMMQAPSQIETVSKRTDFKVLFTSKIDGKVAMQYFDSECSEWSIVMNMPFDNDGLSFATSAYVQNRLYAFGVRDIFIYKPFSTRISTLDTAIQHPALQAWATVLNGKIYLVGGTGRDGKIQRYVQCYDPNTNSCEMKAPTHSEFYHPNAVTLGNYLYVANSENFTIEKYDAGSNSWTIINTPVVNKEEETLRYWQVPLGACAKKLFIYDRRMRLWSYDPERNRWNECRCDIGRVIKGMWGVSTKEEEYPYLLILDDQGTLYQYDPTKETSEPFSGSMAFMGKGWSDILLV